MNETYEWLYDNYTAPLMKRIAAAQDEQTDYLVEELALSGDRALLLRDAMADMRLHWGAEIFALGLQLGVRLVHPQTDKPPISAT